jgi:UDPglucose 6-dehydrogenase
MKVVVVGLWHLGLVYSACLADLGYQVVGVDNNAERVEKLNQGIMPVYEPGLKELIQSSSLYFTSDFSSVKDADFILITIDTPVNDQDEVDLSEIFDVLSKLEGLRDSIIIVSSQVPVGTCEQIKVIVQKNNPSVDIAYSPENLRLGQAIENFKHPERIIVGADNQSTLDRAKSFFSVINAPVIEMDLRSAEMSKHALNAFLGTCISFGNEIGNICDEVGADSVQVVKALRSEKRIGNLPLSAGLGFAGGTLARDLKVLQKVGIEEGCGTPLIDSVLEVNRNQNRIVVQKLQKIYGSVKGLTIGILGLTYKPETSTLRRSAALEVIQELVSKGAKVKAYDPKADKREISGFDFCLNTFDVARDSDALILMTEWPEFKELNYYHLKNIMKHPVFIDAKNFLDKDKMCSIGFIYLGIGRG